MEVVQLREKEDMNKVLHSLMKDADLTMVVDCADRHVQFTVRGWFVFPKGSLTKPHDILEPA